MYFQTYLSFDKIHLEEKELKVSTKLFVTEHAVIAECCLVNRL